MDDVSERLNTNDTHTRFYLKKKEAIYFESHEFRVFLFSTNSNFMCACKKNFMYMCDGLFF